MNRKKMHEKYEKFCFSLPVAYWSVIMFQDKNLDHTQITPEHINIPEWEMRPQVLMKVDVQWRL